MTINLTNKTIVYILIAIILIIWSSWVWHISSQHVEKCWDNFPISSCGSREWGDYFFSLPYSVRVILTLLLYAVLLGVIATIPLYIKGCFEDSVFYSRYKIRWCIIGVILFPSFVSLLFGVTPLQGRFIDNYKNFLFLLTLVITILSVTLIPAVYQNNKAKSK